MRWDVLLLALLALLLSGQAFAACSERQAQEVLASGTEYAFSERVATDYTLVLDRSGSMRGEKLSRAKDAASLFVEQLTGEDRAAIVVFDSRSFTLQRATTDQRSLRAAVDRITLGDYTHYQKGLSEASSQLNGNRDIIIFMSDGKPDDDRQAILDSVEALSQEACVFTIAYADSADAEAQEVLREMAAVSERVAGCGGYFRAGENGFELGHIFSTIYQDVSGDSLLDVSVRSSSADAVSLSVAASSALNGAPLADTCFSPTYSYKLVRNNEIVYEAETASPSLQTVLAPGEYAYYVSVREECGGACLFTGRAEGRVAVDSSAAACPTPWTELQTLLSSREYVEVHLTSAGFSPQTASTEGVVVFTNADSAPRQVVAVDGSWESPLLAPGESWTQVFGTGTHAYRDPDRAFAGSLHHDAQRSHTPVDLVLVLDRSGSMAGQPLLEAKSAAKNLLGILEPQDRSSLVIFSDRAQLSQGLTSDARLLVRAVEAVVSEGSTFYIDPLRIAGEQLRHTSSRREQAVIFLSDGAPFDADAPGSILRTVEEELPDACLFAIGYGDEGVEATELLASMVRHSREENACGAFYVSTADKSELSRVFGEVYASMQEPTLEVYDVGVEDADGGVVLSARVRSLRNGIQVPSVSAYGCVPPAEVFAVFGDKRFPLAYRDGVYSGLVSLPRGSHEGFVSARLVAADAAVRSAIGQRDVTVRIGGSAWLLWILVAGGVVAIGYLFMRGRRPRQYASSQPYQGFS